MWGPCSSELSIEHRETLTQVLKGSVCLGVSSECISEEPLASFISLTCPWFFQNTSWADTETHTHLAVVRGCHILLAWHFCTAQSWLSLKTLRIPVVVASATPALQLASLPAYTGAPASHLQWLYLMFLFLPLKKLDYYIILGSLAPLFPLSFCSRYQLFQVKIKQAACFHIVSITICGSIDLCGLWYYTSNLFLSLLLFLSFVSVFSTTCYNS